MADKSEADCICCREAIQRFNAHSSAGCSRILTSRVLCLHERYFLLIPAQTVMQLHLLSREYISHAP